MEVGTPLTLALQPGAGEGDGLGLGLGVGDGAGDGPVTVFGAVSFLSDPEQAGARSAKVSSARGARTQNSRFILGRIASHPPRPDAVRATAHEVSLETASQHRQSTCAGAHSCNASRAHTRCPYTFDRERTIFSRRLVR